MKKSLIIHLTSHTYILILQVQKSILRDAVSDLALHFLDKIKCMVIKDIEREDVEFVCKSLGCRPIASLDHFIPENLVSADLVEDVGVGGNRMVKITGKFNLSNIFV